MNAPNAECDSQHRGMLVLDFDGQTRFASGLATNPRLATRIIEGWRLAEQADQRVFSISDQFGPLVAVAYPAPDATAIVVMMREPNDSLFEFAATVEFAGDILRHLLTNPYEALTVVDREGIVRYISPVHERFFGLPAGGGLGKHVTQVIENTRLHEVARNGRAEIGQLQVMKDTSRVVTRIPVQGSHGEVVGAIGQVMFKGPEQLQTLSAELSRLRSEVEYYRRELSSLRERSVGLDQLIGDSPAMRRLKQQILKVAPLDVPVLLVGESGTGKELVAQAIHQLSQRREEALVMINAAALPPNLVESELFGYEAGAFTGAERKGRRGKVEQADRSSLFLDELGDMPLEMQVKLLRVLEDGSYERIGGQGSRISNFRLISASNRDFQRLIEEGRFRLDLFYRVSAVTILLPPLRDRLEDIPALARQALKRFAQRHGVAVRRLSTAAIQVLQQHDWPGNVRQLMHVVERAAIFADTDPIGPADFDLQTSTKPDSVSESLTRVEENLIRAALQRCGGNKKRAAAELGISRSYLYKRLAALADLPFS